MYSASQFEKPSVPHAQITAQDGSQWYQLAYGSGASEFYTPAALANVGMGEHLSQEQALASFPGISEQTSLRSVGMPQDGVLEANHPRGVRGVRLIYFVSSDSTDSFAAA